MLIPPEGCEDQFAQALARTPEGQAEERRMRWFRMEQSGALERIAQGTASWEDFEGPLVEFYHDAGERSFYHSLLFGSQNSKGPKNPMVRKILEMIEGNRPKRRYKEWELPV